MKRLLLDMQTSLRRYGVTLLVLGIALLSAQRVLAADNGTTSLTETIQSFIGGIIASTIINLFVQRRLQRTETKADNAQAQVKTLSRELGVDDPQKPTPDVTKMQDEIKELKGSLATVQKELTTTLQERDTARELLSRQVDRNAEDMVNAQRVIDGWERKHREQNDLIAAQENTIGNYEHQLQLVQLNLARLEGRLDEQGKQEQLVNAFKSLTDSFLQAMGRLMPPAPQPEGTPS